MLKTTTLLRPILVGFAALSLTITSCKDDDEPASGAEISFTRDAMTIGEGDGTIEVELVLSKPAPRNFRLTYDVGGTAIEGTTATADFDIQGSFGRIDIDKGETSAFIEIAVKQDDTSEGDEVIVITLDDVNENGIKIGSDDEITITITDDDDDAPLHTVSFVETELTAIESDGLIEIEVTLSTAMEEDVTIMYEIGEEETMAIGGVYGEDQNIPEEYWDYEIQETSGEIEIPAGQTTGKITIKLYSDFSYENTETITLNLKGSATLGIGDNESIIVNVGQEDGRIVALLWDETYTDVDMDMFLWFGEDLSSLEILASSTNIGGTPQLEVLFVPAILPNGTVGFSYTYYSGTPNPMNFGILMIDYIDGAEEGEEEYDAFEGQYTDANKNEWDLEGASDPLVVQSFNVEDGTFVDVTDITIPASSSRAKSYSIPKTIKKANRPSSHLEWFKNRH